MIVYYLGDCRVEEELNARFTAFGFQHGGDLRGGIVTEKLAEGFFVEGDAMFADESDEIGRRVAGECGAGEVRILG